MTDITTRSGKGSPLSNAEMDGNLTALNDSLTYHISSSQDWADYTTASSAGVRKAITGATYKINGSVSRDFSLLLDGQVIVEGGNATRDVDLYTGVGPAFISGAITDNLTFRFASLIATTASMLCDTGSFQLAGLFMDNAFVACNELGTVDCPITAIEGVQFGATGLEVNTGFLFKNIAMQSTSITGSVFVVNNTTTDAVIDFTGALAFGGIRVEITCRGGALATGIKGDANSANLENDAQGLILSCNFKTLAVPTDGINKDSIKWVIRDSRGVESTFKDSLLTLTQPVTPIETEIPSAGDIVTVQGPWVDNNSSQWIVSGARSTYIGVDTIHVPIDAKSAVRPAGGGANRVLDLYIAIGKSGDLVPTPVLESRDFSTSDGGDYVSLKCIWQSEFKTGDFVEVMASNRNHNANLICDSCVLRIN